MSAIEVVEPRPSASTEPALEVARQVQRQWAGTPLRQRLAVVRRLRHAIALDPESLAATVPGDVPGSLHRSIADTLVAEVLPLAEAGRYLERNARRVLADQHLPRRGRPFFLRGVNGVVERVPLGVVLVIGPANYPLFLPAVQVLQALVAGNAVLWKPAPGGADAAVKILRLLVEAGLPSQLLTVLDSEPAAAQSAIQAGVDKVILTGHLATGRTVLRALAETVTPSVMELSGCDAVFVLPGADLAHAARAIAFGMRLNGSATCMAPRRLFVCGSDAAALYTRLLDAFQAVPPVPLPPRIAGELRLLCEDAARQGAVVLGVPSDDAQVHPVLITGAHPQMRCMRADIFAPVLSAMQVEDEAAALRAYDACPYALTASIFGPARTAEQFARRIHAGTVLINDVIVGTADPRLPFSGRGLSGFGATRGDEGLLEMTAVRSVVTQRSRSPRPYAPTTPAHTPFFSAYIRTVHSATWGERVRAFRALVSAARTIPAHTAAETPAHREDI